MKKTIFLAALLIHFSVSAQIITTIAGGGTTNPGDGGQATDCLLDSPTGVAVDAGGNFYICERDAHRVRRVTSGGTITTIAGIGMAGYSGDGGPATAAEVQYPYCITFDDAGNIYIGDQSTIRKIDNFGIISTYAGTGTPGFNGDGGPATSAQLQGVSGLAIDAMGNVLIAELGSNRVRKIDASGIIRTIAGTGATLYNGENIPATAANIGKPAGIAVDGTGNIYIVASSNHRIRKIDPAGIITTIAGNGTQGFSGDGGNATSAQLDRPIGICMGSNGVLYLGATFNDRVRAISNAGIITTIAGNGLSVFSGDGGTAITASIYNPIGVALDAGGNLLVCDFGNNRIRRIGNVVEVNDIPVNAFINIKLFPNPSNGRCTMQVSSAVSKEVTIVVVDILGRKIEEITGKTNSDIAIDLDVPSGIYIATVIAESEIISEKLNVVK